MINRMLVYEHIDNGTLCNWLHGYMGQMSPVSWGMRMNIILGVAKGCVLYWPLLAFDFLKYKNTFYIQNWLIFEFSPNVLLFSTFGWKHSWQWICLTKINSIRVLLNNVLLQIDISSWGYWTTDFASGN